MDISISSGPLHGRPYGGTAAIVHKKHAGNIKCIVSAERFTVISCSNWLIIGVYMPSAGTNDRSVIYQDVLCELQGVIDAHSHLDCLFVGDFNVDLQAVCLESRIMNDFITDNHFLRCDALFPLSDYSTYVCDSLGRKSCIDYALTSNSQKTVAFNLLDIDVNLSDHIPLLTVLSCSELKQTVECKPNEILLRRWDHAPIDLYYECTRVLLEPVLCKLNSICEYPMNVSDILPCIDGIYNDVVVSLRAASDLHIPKYTRNFFKFWWNEELEALKSAAISSCRNWKEAGRPRHGDIYTRYNRDKLQYKRRLREDQARETTVFTNELHEALLRKSGRQFWNVWNSKFESKSHRIIQVDNSVDRTVIMDNFARYFEFLYTPSNHARNEELKAKYDSLKEYHFVGLTDDDRVFDVALISKLVSNLKNGRAPGLDDISAEHLKFSHPIVIIILSKLFNLFLTYSHIPLAFGLTYTVPIPKCNSVLKAMTSSDFRGICISPIISKLFESAIINKFCNYFITSDFQFGFKKHLSCNHVIYSVRNVVDHYVANGSTVNICSLDLSKAFDTMNHYVLLTKLISRKLPLQLLNILELWFKISKTCVKWEGYFSSFFSASCWCQTRSSSVAAHVCHFYR